MTSHFGSVVPDRWLATWVALALMLSTAAVQANPLAEGDPERIRLERDAAGHQSAAPQAAALSSKSKASRGATTWRSLGPFGGQVGDVARSPTDPNLLIAATVRGAFRSTDDGATWSPSPTAGVNEMFAVAFDSTGRALVGGIAGLYASDDGGLTFSEVLPFGFIVRTIAVDPSDDDNLWVGLLNQGGFVIFESNDGGSSWSGTGPAPGADCTSLVVDPSDSNTVWATFGGSGNGSVFVTTDGGTIWTDRSAGLPTTPIETVALTPTQLIVGGGQLFGSQNFGLYSSTNDGMTWTALHDGSWPLLVVRDLSVDPNDSQTLLVATDGTGVHRSTNGGSTWEISIAGTAGLALLSVDHGPGDSNEVLLGASSRGFFRSTDGGDAFTNSNQGLELLDVQAVAANPLDADELAVAYSGLNDGGLFTTTDGGATWVEEPVPATRWDGVRFDGQGTLYATSDGPSTVGVEGLYRREPGGSWTALGPFQGNVFETDVSVIRFPASDPDQILLAGADTNVVGGNATIWRTLDRGASWTKVYASGSNTDGEFRDLDVVSEATTEGGGPLMVAARWFGTTGGVARSNDGGASWVESSAGIPASADPSGLCVFPGTTSPIYLADRGSSPSGGVWTSTDGAQSWQQVGFVGAALQHVACGGDGALYATRVFNGDAVNRSTDGGLSFAPFVDGLENAGPLRFLDVDPGAGSRLLFGAFSGSYSAPLDSSLFSDGFESGDLTAWSSANP